MSTELGKLLKGCPAYELAKKVQAYEEGIERVMDEIWDEIHRREGKPNLGKKFCIRRLDELLENIKKLDS